MLKEKLKTNNKINANAVGADDPVCPHFEEPTQNKNLISNLQPLTSDHKGITLIALIITIIVMLILVGVTISVALNGGLFEKAESAVTQTKIEQVKEALEIKKAEILAENDGEKPKDGYSIGIDDLNIPDNLKEEYKNKLKIGEDWNLYYDPEVVKDTNEQNLFKAHGITELKEEHYTFTLNSLGEWTYSDSFLMFNLKNVWSKIGKDLSTDNNYAYVMDGESMFAINSDNENFDSLFNMNKVKPGANYLVCAYTDNEKFVFMVKFADGEDLSGREEAEDFITNYGDITFEFGDASTIQF